MSKKGQLHGDGWKINIEWQASGRVYRNRNIMLLINVTSIKKKKKSPWKKREDVKIDCKIKRLV